MNSRSYCDFVDELVAKVGYPLTIFADNLSAHASRYTRDYLHVTHPQVGHIFNVPYRPDLNGIEHYWRPLKAEYRKRVCNFKANTACFSNRALVQEVFADQERRMPEFAKKCAHDGWQALYDAAPIADPHRQLAQLPVLKLKRR